VAGNDGKAAGIDPGALYTLVQVTTLVLNRRTERPVDLRTLHYWRRQGRLRVLERSLGARRYYLVRGSDLLEAVAVRAGFQVKAEPKKGKRKAAPRRRRPAKK
jgi:hypothetical protein